MRSDSYSAESSTPQVVGVSPPPAVAAPAFPLPSRSYAGLADNTSPIYAPSTYSPEAYAPPVASRPSYSPTVTTQSLYAESGDSQPSYSHAAYAAPAPAPVPSYQPPASQAAPTAASAPSYRSQHIDQLPPYPGALAPVAPTNPQVDLLTHQGFDVGLQVSSYRYQEHVVSNEDFMYLEGVKYGFTLDGTVSLPYNFFATADFRLAYGGDDYWSAPTGTISGAADDLVTDTRLLVGKDFQITNQAHPKPFIDLSPYLGLGYRYLNNSPKSDGEVDGLYRRVSNYFYVPIGATTRFRVTDDSRISLNTELDLLWRGEQDTYLNQLSPLYPNTVNTQTAGYGLRGDLMYELGSWAAGPFFDYWNIYQSDTNSFLCVDGNTLAVCTASEPHNQTIEWGAQVRYHF